MTSRPRNTMTCRQQLSCDLLCQQHSAVFAAILQAPLSHLYPEGIEHCIRLNLAYRSLDSRPKLVQEGLQTATHT